MFFFLIFAMSGSGALSALGAVSIFRVFRGFRLARLLRGLKSMVQIINVISSSKTFTTSLEPMDNDWVLEFENTLLKDVKALSGVCSFFELIVIIQPFSRIQNQLAYHYSNFI